MLEAVRKPGLPARRANRLSVLPGLSHGALPLGPHHGVDAEHWAPREGGLQWTSR